VDKKKSTEEEQGRTFDPDKSLSQWHWTKPAVKKKKAFEKVNAEKLRHILYIYNEFTTQNSIASVTTR
jgi:hypothetical protein